MICDNTQETTDLLARIDRALAALELSMADQRQHVRYFVARSAQAIPLLPDGALDWSNRLPGCTVDISEGGIGLELATGRCLPARAMLIGVEDSSGSLEFEGVEVCHATQVSDARLRLGTKFGGLAHDIIAPEQRLPKFDPRIMQYSSRLPAALVKNWSDLGVMQSVTLDRVELCPRCRTLPTFRQGCPVCGSGRTISERWLHHFECAHAGPASDYEVDSALVCPKCRKRNLVIGADFEYHRGAHRCIVCAWTGVELEQIGHCLRCSLRFPRYQAFEQELVGYDVQRLDPLAFICAP